MGLVAVVNPQIKRVAWAVSLSSAVSDWWNKANYASVVAVSVGHVVRAALGSECRWSILTIPRSAVGIRRADDASR